MAEKLSKLAWIKHGLKVLSSHGAGALKADTLSKSLNVSRGSFYWHFKDIDAFRASVLEQWRMQSTLQVIEKTSSLTDERGRFETLVLQAFSSDPQLERAIRAWAIQDEDAAKRANAVDQERIAYLVELISSLGVARDQARQRAVFVYWAYLGRTIAPSGEQASSPDEDIASIIELVMSPRVTQIDPKSVSES